MNRNPFILFTLLISTILASCTGGNSSSSSAFSSKSFNNGFTSPPLTNPPTTGNGNGAKSLTADGGGTCILSKAPTLRASGQNLPIYCKILRIKGPHAPTDLAWTSDIISALQGASIFEDIDQEFKIQFKLLNDPFRECGEGMNSHNYSTADFSLSIKSDNGATLHQIGDVGGLLPSSVFKIGTETPVIDLSSYISSAANPKIELRIKNIRTNYSCRWNANFQPPAVDECEKAGINSADGDITYIKPHQCIGLELRVSTFKTQAFQ